MVLVSLLQESGQCSGAFLFYFSSFFWFCPSIMLLEQCVVAEVGYNWYLHDINIYSLLKMWTLGSQIVKCMEEWDGDKFNPIR
jgi:hypothetical protein